MERDRLVDAGHRHVAERFRLISEATGGEALERDGAFLWAAATDYAALMNGVVRLADGLDADATLAAADEFFGERGRGYTVLTRGVDGIDADLDAALEDRGAEPTMERFPVMVRHEPLGDTELPADTELRRVEDEAGVRDYIAVCDQSYTSLGFPTGLMPEVIVPEWMLRDDVAAVVGYLDGEPASAAAAIVSHGVAGLIFVGTTEAARGKGLAGACTCRTTDLGLGLGAESAWLEASTMGESLYERLGYEHLFPYRFWIVRETG